jgi:hypothetical protein
MTMFDKVYELSMSRRYVSRWGLTEAVREIVQNALDSESPFIYSFNKTSEDEYVLTINSEFTTLPASSLLLGATSKADSSDSIGSFGEGFKLAILVLTRLCIKVQIYNGSVLWTPGWKHSKMFNDEVLAITESVPSEKMNKGLTFKIFGLSEAQTDAIKLSCIRMQDHIGAIKQTSYGDILLEKPGELYVGGLFICKVDTKFGYNILPRHVNLERDRQTVNSWDLQSITTQMWFETKEFDRIAEMIKDEINDVGYAKYTSTEIVKEACYRLFRQKHPSALIAESAKELEDMVKQGMTDTVYIGSDIGYLVKGSKSYTSVRPALVAQQNPEEYLRAWLRNNRSEMRSKAIESFKHLLSVSTNWKLK